MNLHDFEEAEYSLELPIGARFYYEGKSCEVVETQPGGCKECVAGYDICMMHECDPEFRQDGKNVGFRWVEEQRDNNEVKRVRDSRYKMQRYVDNRAEA